MSKNASIFFPPWVYSISPQEIVQLLYFLENVIKCLDLDDTSGQLKLEGRLCIVFVSYAIFKEKVPFYWQFSTGRTALLAIWEI